MSQLEIADVDMLREFRGSSVRVVFGHGALEHLGELVMQLRASRVLLVTDAGIRSAGHVDRALGFLSQSVISAQVFEKVVENPTTATVEAGCAIAQEFQPDLLVGLGGGSAMDTAKGINFLFSNGGSMADYWGLNKAVKPMLPLVAVPTTTGTGSEAQSYALICDAQTNVKMACGDKKALPRMAILDPQLATTQPARVAATAGIDAVAHSIETAACTKRNPTSRDFSRKAWELLQASYERIVRHQNDGEAMADMLLGAHFAGCAIENSMLGAAHAAANPLTARFGITHGVAVGVMLPHVVRFNAQHGENPYADLMDDAESLARRIEQMLDAAALPRSLRELDVPEQSLSELAAMAATQWTAKFNPRAVGRDEFQKLYETAFG